MFLSNMYLQPNTSLSEMGTVLFDRKIKLEYLNENPQGAE